MSTDPSQFFSPAADFPSLVPGFSGITSPLNTDYREYSRLAIEVYTRLGRTETAKEWAESVTGPVYGRWGLLRERTRHILIKRLGECVHDLDEQDSKVIRNADFLCTGIVPPFEQLVRNLDLTLLNGDSSLVAEVRTRFSWFRRHITRKILGTREYDLGPTFKHLYKELCRIESPAFEEACKLLYDFAAYHWHNAPFTVGQQLIAVNIFTRLLDAVDSAQRYGKPIIEDFRTALGPIPAKQPHVQAQSSSSPVLRSNAPSQQSLSHRTLPSGLSQRKLCLYE